VSGRRSHPALESLAARAAGDGTPTVGWPEPLAVGWATVELDRAEREVMKSLGGSVRFRPAVGSALLGASCRVAAPRVQGEPWVVLLEPSTEGRLAASLARLGEGWLAVWFEVAAFARGDVRVQLSTSRPGPLGPERLVLGDAVTGPHRLVVEAATIAP
jgi:hypothetical protein